MIGETEQGVTESLYLCPSISLSPVPLSPRPSVSYFCLSVPSLCHSALKQSSSPSTATRLVGAQSFGFGQERGEDLGGNDVWNRREQIRRRAQGF